MNPNLSLIKLYIIILKLLSKDKENNKEISIYNLDFFLKELNIKYID
jgi:hypothetical protein